MRFCRERGIRLVPQGAHTGLAGAATPDDSGTQIVLSLERIAKVEIDPLNRTAICGAGALLSSLNSAAAAFDLCLPIDLGADPSLGGMVATNTGGARLLRYGGMREQVIGLAAVLGDQDLTLVRDLKGLRKNNVGVDLRQLMIGSGGRLGVVTQVQVELQPVIAQSITALAVPCSTADIPRIVALLEKTLDHFLLACEGMSRAAMQAALDTHPALRAPFANLPEFALLIEVGTSAALPDMDVASLLETALAACLEADPPCLTDAIIGRGHDFWTLRHAISDGLKSLGKVIGLDIAVRRDRLFSLRDRLIEAVSQLEPDLLVADFGHVADGGMHFNMVAPAALDEERITRLRTAVFDIVVREFEGSFSAEHGVGPTNLNDYKRYRDEDERRVIEQQIGRASCRERV